MLALIRELMGWGDSSRNPLEDANAALTLCDWMKKHGWPMEFSTIPNIKEWTVTFGWDRSIKATANTLPLAICKTFLLANNLAQ